MDKTAARRLSTLFLVLGLLSLADLASAQDYVSGHGALEVWDAEGRAGVPLWVRIWLTILQSTFISGLVFVRRNVEARWAVGGFFGVFASAVLSQTLTDIVPLSGFIALLHVLFWSPALYVLLSRRPFLKGRSIYAAWSALMTFVILFSFVFDIPYTLVYFDHLLGLDLLT
ncbi:MAG: hypothetical protein MI746_17470 [Pseudomonadales bacterium]|nr:hypothetical protein [Pseudomonadales bacterium]